MYAVSLSYGRETSFLRIRIFTMQTIVIGGGAAGMMAAVACADAGDSVILLEKNEKLGKKVFITGKGRCNVTNACDRDAFFSHVVSNPKFLYSAYSQFDNEALMEFIEANGTALKVERGNRVFPVSDHSYDIIDAFKRALSKRKVDVRLHCEVKDILTEEYIDPEDKKAPSKIIKGVKLSSGEILSADKVIVATGGVSYPSTGSTGDGYDFASKTGHKLVASKPALVPFTTKEEWVTQLQGLTLKNVKLSLYINDKCVYSEQGELLFTHFGISGPLALTASSYYAKADEIKSAYVYLDLKPALSSDEFDKRLIREFENGNRKEFKNILGELYPQKLASLVCDITGLDPYKRCNEISGAERKTLLKFTKEMKITITGTRDFNEAIITHGGVSVKDINPKTMESKLVKNLYFAGEVLDLDAHTGGFNLQIAFSTGYLAGKSGYES